MWKFNHMAKNKKVVQMMNENKFIYKGKRFKTKEVLPYNPSCKDCYFENKPCFSLHDAKFIPGCMEFERKDGKDVIFVEVEDESMEQEA